jgi:putative heme-binding domain-containing protein
MPPSVRQDLLAIALANNDRPTIARLLAGVTTATNGAYTPDQLEAFARFLDLLSLKRQSLARLSEPGDELASHLKQTQAITDAARRIVASPMASDAALRAAVPLLARSSSHAKDDLPMLAALLVARIPVDVQTSAVKTISRTGHATAPDLLTRNWASHSPALRSAIVDQLLNREDWALHLLASVEAKRIGLIDIDVPRRERLLRHKSERVKALAEKLFRSITDTAREQVIAQHRDLLSMKSDPKRGAKVFSVHCATCHRVETLGQDVGPSLAAVRSWSGEAMLTAILDPDRQVEPRYLSYNATLNNGEILFGIITAETGNSLTLKGLDGQDRTVLRSNLKSITSTNRSLMPVGFEEGMSKQEMADLIAFLQNPVASN